MKNFVIVLAFATTFSVPAGASDQLALSLGVDPGMYSTAELASLADAREAGDIQRERFILGGGGEILSTQSYGDRPSAQLAMGLGVEPGMYSTAELAGLAHARGQGDIQREKFILGGGSEILSTQSYGESPSDQLALSLGVEPGMYSTAELALMKSAN